jgi:transposase InsO family protein
LFFVFRRREHGAERLAQPVWSPRTATRALPLSLKEYKKLLEANKMVGSMSRKSNPYDNAPMESLFRLLKVEHVYKRSFATIAQAAASLKKWLDYSNIRRRHSALVGISPLMCEIRRNHAFGLSA